MTQIERVHVNVVERVFLHPLALSASSGSHVRSPCYVIIGVHFGQLRASPGFEKLGKYKTEIEFAVCRF